jgi:AraC family transcriptional regulator, positive regulator of tynA and feaB
MQTFFSTDGLRPRDAFRRWQEVICDQFAHLSLKPLDGAAFHGRVEVGSIGPLLLTKSSYCGLRSVASAEALRRAGKADHVFALFNVAGQNNFQQGDSEVAGRTGDLVLFDHRPFVFETQAGSSMMLELPRARVEAMLGPSRLFCALTAGAELPATTLATSYIRDLIRVGDQLSPEGAARMASIGVDLIVASLAERMAREVPGSIHGSVTVQRAKAYVEANLGDVALDPPQLAAAVGVSLRRLQELFHERGRHISDYIWERRLEAAAKRLADPACAHLSIGMLAYGCGFTSQAHFSRRFKNRHGMTPREYRHASQRDTIVQMFDTPSVPGVPSSAR